MDKREVFISYHTESSRERVIEICNALENAGVSCWYAPRDVSGKYASAIERAIDECQIFLLLLNEGSNRSQHVLNELDSAFDRFNRDEKIELLPFLVGECQLSLDMRYYIRRIHMMDGTNPPDEVRTRELVDRICKKLGKNPERFLRQPEKVYRIVGQMVYPDTHFVGRNQELEELHTHLTGTVNKAILVGMGGIGKSEIAKMYLKEHTQDYDVILWISFDGSLQQTVASDALFPIQGMRHSDYPEDSQRDYFLRKLQMLKQIADRRVLIVMDNFDVTDDPDLDAFCGGSYGALFTTRYHQTSCNLPEVKVSGMTDSAELMKLFRAEYRRPLSDTELETVYRIMTLLEGHPLSVRLVASAMQKNRRMDPQTMLEMLNTGTAHGEKQGAKGTGTIGQYLHQVFQVADLCEEEQMLLKNLALIPIQGINITKLYDWCELDDFDVIDGLIAKSWVIHDSVEDSVHLHPLVADLMLEELSKDSQCCDTLVENIHRACFMDLHYTWEEKVWLYSLSSTLYSRLPLAYPRRFLALDSKARLTMSMARYEEAALLFRKMLPFAEQLEEKLELYHKQAHSWILGNFGAEGIEAAEEGIALIGEKTLDQLTNHEGYYLNELYRRMTESYILVGCYENAVEYARKALSFCDRFVLDSLEGNHGWVQFHLARALMFAQEYAEAEEVIRDAIERFERVNSMWSANYAYDVLGQILIHRGQYEEALDLNVRAAKILEPYYGKEHADVAKNLEYRGNIYAAMGQREKANGYYQQAIDIYLKRNCRKRADGVMAKM